MHVRRRTAGGWAHHLPFPGVSGVSGCSPTAARCFATEAGSRDRLPANGALHAASQPLDNPSTPSKGRRTTTPQPAAARPGVPRPPARPPRVSRSTSTQPPAPTPEQQPQQPNQPQQPQPPPARARRPKAPTEQPTMPARVPRAGVQLLQQNGYPPPGSQQPSQQHLGDQSQAQQQMYVQRQEQQQQQQQQQQAYQQPQRQGQPQLQQHAPSYLPQQGLQHPTQPPQLPPSPLAPPLPQQQQHWHPHLNEQQQQQGYSQPPQQQGYVQPPPQQQQQPPQQWYQQPATLPPQQQQEGYLQHQPQYHHQHQPQQQQQQQHPQVNSHLSGRAGSSGGITAPPGGWQKLPTEMDERERLEALCDLLEEEWDSEPLPQLKPGSTVRATCPQCGNGAHNEDCFAVTTTQDALSVLWCCHRAKCGFKGGRSLLGDAGVSRAAEGAGGGPTGLNGYGGSGSSYGYGGGGGMGAAAALVQRLARPEGGGGGAGPAYGAHSGLGAAQASPSAPPPPIKADLVELSEEFVQWFERERGISRRTLQENRVMMDAQARPPPRQGGGAGWQRQGPAGPDARTA
ncbi:hypothetical protein MNEG_3985 [Monoraphidium neglectum]|uniref:Uncharacterized protein n=1 Tax=Monoraphidium neglectum TaxID=145388 RepID=A0A0D2NFT4_9CHLO|nr:hypothetical protein MNEG_3985 [Monoraphidium neglectum]KIZ03966.1 hypothetical protein MNEG_3985 [Monoraphidium neglectum]|eukprot:XP_013902985.1 hypothetical protein MNEG_3985 [Monoraphidium neglectum]